MWTVMQQAHSKDRELLADERRELGKKFYRSVVSEEQEALASQLPADFFHWHNDMGIEVRFKAAKNSDKFDESISFRMPIKDNEGSGVFPLNRTRYLYLEVSHTGELVNTVQEFPVKLIEEAVALARKAIEDRKIRDKLVEDTEQVLRQLRTVNNLRERAPALYDLLPAKYLADTQFPTTDIGDVLTRLAAAGIPPDKEAA